MRVRVTIDVNIDETSLEEGEELPTVEEVGEGVANAADCDLDGYLNCTGTIRVDLLSAALVKP